MFDDAHYWGMSQGVEIVVDSSQSGSAESANGGSCGTSSGGGGDDLVIRKNGTEYVVVPEKEEDEFGDLHIDKNSTGPFNASLLRAPISMFLNVAPHFAVTSMGMGEITYLHKVSIKILDRMGE